MEAFIKTVAYGRLYFQDNWNTYDFLLTLVSCIMMPIQIITNAEANQGALIFRAFRVTRLLNKFKQLNSLRYIVQTFVSTLPPLMNIGSLMMLFIFIYAILGMNLFSQIKLNPPMNENLNFMNIGNSYLTLIRMATGEGWNDLMEALSMDYTLHNQCKKHPTYADFVENDHQPIGCGLPIFAMVFFYSYILIVSVTFVNLFIAVILDGYFTTVEGEK